ncbi:bifunctional 4-hydroxy-2-oxoglutarate aldolase/2-dehydro-3-deoxy-phosphogluconate aldolase [Micromonospora yasonensis]|uniref:bifunctional 4-hydroxy-2-oxoglutarate aldolase/2-dehydro-3-deoxy-phosphogluconate aldolase n=1 Tax=Micromonospora yasonensis TaxID=1128667 RepID=UPI002230CC01|nr:bifunctional 4-hydroxy-2-oxoglutarate aldolase/2-dehydro-3-deoxy-phosphogluconate aldolase [Micromonospora yasonensis]MCW3843313.1 bifunctional 4-hydroxy-2-oxoglutarate aldolase/2-dehydro-3-deoxy-phosphogluconate aldolase [Micromonospora yasonensis]
MTALRGARVIAIVRLPAPDAVLRTARELATAGLPALEVTLTTPRALDAVAALRAELDDSCAVGAGSVRTAADVTRARDAGAQFLVTPTTRAEVLTQAAEAGLPVVCGALTPTEVDLAWSAGASLVKLFPASLGGPAYLRELCAPLPDVPLVPTGGVSAESVHGWAAAGAVAVGVGGSLVNATDIAANDWAALRRRARAFLAAAGSAPWPERPPLSPAV